MLDIALAHSLETLFPPENRFDANETAHLDRQLRHVLSRVQDVKYAALKAAALIPVSSEVHEGAKTFSYYQWDLVGIAKLIAKKGTDLPRVDAFATEHVAKVYQLGNEFAYDTDDLRAAALSGSMLPMQRAEAARRAHSRKVEDMAALGDTDVGTTGLLNNPNVSVDTAPATGTGSSPLWSTKTPALVLADLHFISRQPHENSGEAFDADVMLLPTAHYNYIHDTGMGDSSGDTILTRFRKQSGRITQVVSWNKLALADAAGTGPRIMVYKRDPEVLQLHLPMGFRALPPQPRGLELVVPCESKIGGVSWYYPLAAAYMDGIGAAP